MGLMGLWKSLVGLRDKSFYCLKIKLNLKPTAFQLLPYIYINIEFKHLVTALIKNFDDEIQIVIACKAGDAVAQKLLIKQYLPYVKTICFRYKSNENHMDEIVNDSFLKIFQKLDQFDTTKSLTAWIRTIVINTSIDYYRKHSRMQFNANIDDVDVGYEGNEILAEMAGEEILKLIEKLPTSYRLVFTLYVIDGYSHKEIAELLGIKEGTSKSNLQDARIKLQEMVKYEYPVLYKLYSIKGRVNEKR